MDSLNSDMEMYVEKRNGGKEIVSFDKILKRMRLLGQMTTSYGIIKHVNYTEFVMKVISQLYDVIPTKYIDELCAQQCASLSTTHPDYGELASRIMISNHHKNTKSSYLEVVKTLYENTDIHGNHTPIVNEELYKFVQLNIKKIEENIVYDRDYLIDYFGFKTLERAYLMRVNNIIQERPQHMWMRVALSIHIDNIERAIETYHLMSQKYFTHATPTLFNAGTNRQQLSSCYLIGMENDSITGIYNTLSDCASISKWAGGIGLHIHNVRATGSQIRGTNGTSNGIVPMLKVFNNTARYVDQCVVPETTIYTNKGPLQIQNCDDETSVFTTKGMETIENVLEHPYDGPLINIQTTHSFEPMRITPEHPVLCIQNQPKGVSYDVIKKRLENGSISPQWIEAKELTMNDMVIMTIPNYKKDDKMITKDDCYFYGLLLGHGCMNNNSTNTYISLNTISKDDKLEFIKSYLENQCIEYNITTENNSTRISWNKTINLPFRYSTLYNDNKEKRIHSKWLHLPRNKVIYIVKGLLNSDVCFLKEITFDNTSKVLIEGLRYILLRFGVPTGGFIHDITDETPTTKYGDTIENKNLSYIIHIPKKEYYELFSKDEIKKYDETMLPSNSNFFTYYYDNKIFTRITGIQQETYTGTLYDLQMKNTHNYLIHNATIHNGGGKRNGSFAIYLEPWHYDIEDFIQMKKNHGDEEKKARDLFYALWIPDLFMERVKTNSTWTLMCPDKCPGLSDVYGEEFKTLYEKYERENKGNKTIQARELWLSIMDSQIETGTPYMLYKDAANKKSNHKHLGTIKSSNLCTEIIEYSDDKETAVCNLASIGLSKFVIPPNVEELKRESQKITIYSKSNCGYCLLSKSLLKKYEIEYEEKLLDNDEDRNNFYRQINKEDGYGLKENDDGYIKTMPQIYINNKRIGGYDVLKTYFKYDFDYNMLYKITRVVTRNLNKVIDINFYPTEKTKISNMKHRPIGIGIQGLADVFAKMNIAFDSEEAKEVNKHIFETIYFASLTESNEIAKERYYNIQKVKSWLGTKIHWVEKENDSTSSHIWISDTVSQEDRKMIQQLNLYPDELERKNEKYVGSYISYEGSPVSDGILQFDMWNQIPTNRYNWLTLRENIQSYGVRNSLLLAPMPTASTSQILGNNECFEPFTSNIYVRRTNAGEFVMINKYLLEDMISMGMWNVDMKNNIIANKGSIQHIENIPKHIKNKYKTVWEISMKNVIDMSRDRGYYICQSQSLNLWIENPSYEKLTSMHFYAWKQGLKTGMYYLRTKAKAAPQQFTIDPSLTTSKLSSQYNSNNNNSLDDDICESCSG
jgi:ribonucleotide reductase alpha subunit